MKHFAYLKPDITVVTAVTPEHMAFFKTLDAVAAEELSVFDYSKKVLVNGDNVPGKYLIGRQFTEYSVRTNAAHNYYAKPHNHHLGGQDLQMETPSGSLQGSVKFVGAQGAICSLAAVAVADMLGLSRKDIIAALPALEPYAGRMRVLEGVKGATIIDDTYNASPVAVKAALDVLYAAKTKQRIALLGSMNELGEYSREAHTEVGAYCNPRKLDLVLTLGRDAERWIAPTAKAQGCVVHSFKSHQACADFIKKHLKKDAVILAKGSQNGVFAEEVVKLLLAHPADASKLVRQSNAWLKIKSKQFND
jgi:UDP-N-acetylmuramoyl-tripeptide--D-alanyl-D-alanine ligase